MSKSEPKPAAESTCEVSLDGSSILCKVCGYRCWSQQAVDDRYCPRCKAHHPITQGSEKRGTRSDG